MASMETHIIRAKQKRRWREHTAAQRRKRARRDRQGRAAACCALALSAALGFAWAVLPDGQCETNTFLVAQGIRPTTAWGVAGPEPGKLRNGEDSDLPGRQSQDAPTSAWAVPVGPEPGKLRNGEDSDLPGRQSWNEAGEFRVYHYCPCAKCCGKTDGVTFTGTQATAGRTVSVDPKVIPLGSEVLLNGQVYIAEDTGVHGHCVDVFVEDHREALRLGTYVTDVKWRADR